MYGIVTCGTSSLKMYVTSSWKIGTELVQPCGNFTSLRAPKGVWNVVKSRDPSAMSLWSYPEYKSRQPPQALPAKWLASSSVAGGTPECAMVTAFNGSNACTKRILFPSFLTTPKNLPL